jgi:hypothetical protein
MWNLGSIVSYPGAPWVPARFARTLERELADTRDAYLNMAARWNGGAAESERDQLRAELAEAKRLLSETYRNTNLRFHPELSGLAETVSKYLNL